MHITRILPLVALTSAVSLFSYDTFSGGLSDSSSRHSQLRLQGDGDEDPLSVPGDNPLLFCQEPEDYLLEIANVDLDPNPPKAGTELEIKATGTLKTRIEEGAYIAIQVKYGLITLIKQKIDLCEQAKNVGEECPLDEGDLKLTKVVTLPREVPPGLYTVLADVFTKDDERITCLTAKIRFSRGGSD